MDAILWSRKSTLLLPLYIVFLLFSHLTGENRNPDDLSSGPESPEDSIPHRSVVRLVITGGLLGALGGCPSCGPADQVLPGHVVMSKELCRQLGMEHLSLVRLQSASYGPSDIQGIVLHPLENCPDKVHCR